MTKTPKGAASASDSKAIKANAAPLSRGRRSHDPNRALASLPASRLIDKVYNIPDTKLMSKGLLTVLATLANLKESQLPIGPNEKNLLGRPVVYNFNQFIDWAKNLSIDEGFIVVSLFGCTGSGKCISKGPFCGKNMHINSGGLTFTNKRGSHILLCGTNSHNSAHAFVDLSDPYVKLIASCLAYLKYIAIDDGSTVTSTNNNFFDEDIAFQEDITSDVSYPLFVDTVKLINPNIKCQKYDNPDIKLKAKIEKPKLFGSGYYSNIELPPSDDDEDDEEGGDGTSNPNTKKKVTKKSKQTTITLNQPIDENQEEDSEDSEDDEDSDD
jgi:hypothetical protein